jgi:23S rRNA pseudouridine1911/1915/1917 synthase
VHRLDKGTSGVIVVAKNDAAHLELSRQFNEREVKKIYNALVFGIPKTSSGIIDKPIGRHVKERKIFSTKTRKGRVAVTEWRLKKAYPFGVAWLEVNIKTGRTHQIRVHLSEAGHPLVGDATYGSARQLNRINNKKAREVLLSMKRPVLHSSSLQITHPRTHQKMIFKADMPADISGLLKRLETI